MGRRRKDSDGSIESDDAFVAMGKFEKCYLNVVLIPIPIRCLYLCCNSTCITHLSKINVKIVVKPNYCFCSTKTDYEIMMEAFKGQRKPTLHSTKFLLDWYIVV